MAQVTLSDAFWLLIYALAAWRATKIVIEDEILADFREKWWSKWPPESTKRGYLITCYWCLGLWFSALFGLLFLFGGMIGLVIAVILAISAIVGLIQAFSER